MTSLNEQELNLTKELAQYGVNLNHVKHRRGLEEREAEAVARAKREANPVKNPVAASRLESFVENSTIVAVAFTTILFSLVLFGLFAVETAALIHGLELLLRFWEAMLLAPVLLASLYVAMFLAETQRPEEEREQFQTFTLRVLVGELLYLVGVRRLRQIEYPEYAATRAVERGLALVVVSISILGRLSPILQGTEGMNVVNGYNYLITTTSLLDLLSAVAIGAATIVAIASSHFIYGFIWRVFQKTTGGFDLSGKASDASDYEALRSIYCTEARVEYLRNLYLLEKAKHGQSQVDLPSSSPDSEN